MAASPDRRSLSGSRFLFPALGHEPRATSAHAHPPHLGCTCVISEGERRPRQPRRIDGFGELLFNTCAVCVCARAGDTIASVNESRVDGFRHKEIVQLIRACGNTVRYGDASQTVEAGNEAG